MVDKLNLHDYIVTDQTSIKEAMEKMEKNGKQIVYVVKEKKLVGSLSDGDIRRWILKDKSIQEITKYAMNKNPKYLINGNKSEVLELLSKYNYINSVPIIDSQLAFKNIIFRDETKVLNKNLSKVPVIIMAGGKGTRLYPYTKILPKPLIPIGDTPIIERIINKFTEDGINDFVISVNYKKNMIKSYFNDLDKKYNVNFIEEDIPLGTGGSLSLMREKLTESFFVSNCDILVNADYSDIYEFHKKNNHDVTMIASMSNTQIPYGVLNLDKEGLLDSTVEKPEYSHLVNTGMYLIEPTILKFVPDNKFSDLPNIIMDAKNSGLKIGVYPISENSWMDMGQIKEMENMIERLDV